MTHDGPEAGDGSPPYGGDATPPPAAPGPTPPPNPYDSPYTPYGTAEQPPAWGSYPGAAGGAAYRPAPPADGLGIAAMIVGIASIALACGYGVTLLAAPVALVMGKMSMTRIDRSAGQLGGRGMALAGFILGIVGTVFLIILALLVALIVVVGVSGGFDQGY